MSVYYYKNGAIHNDHHKEMSINVSNKADIASLMKAFMTDEPEEAEEILNVKETVTGLEGTNIQPICPPELNTPEAEYIFCKLYEAGIVDEQKQTQNLSFAEKGILAFQISVRLDIRSPWKVFSTLWGSTPGTLRSAYNRAIDQRKTGDFLEKLKNVLS